MKNIVLACVLFLGFVGCTNQRIEVRQEKKTENTKAWSISIEMPRFSSENKEVAVGCDVINTEVNGMIDDWMRDFKKQVNEYVHGFDTIPDAKPMGPLELWIDDSVFLANQHLVSLRFRVYTSLAGANGETRFYALNYDLKQGKFLSPEEMLDFGKSESINQILKANFKNPENCFSGEPTIEKCTAINIGVKDVCFTYEKYVLGPGGCGDISVNASREEMKGMLLVE